LQSTEIHEAHIKLSQGRNQRGNKWRSQSP